MFAKAAKDWWILAKPYYTKAYPEIFVGIPIMAYFYYKLAHGGKKAVKDTSSGHH